MNIYNSFSLLRLIGLALVLLSSPHHTTTNASSSANFGSRSRYAAYDYDLTTPQYTPDGRLLQVEYALNACRRDGSNPIVSVGMCIPGKKDFYRRRLLKQQKLNDGKGEGNDESGLEIVHHGEEDQGGDALLIMATISSPLPSSSSADAVSNKSKQNSDEDQTTDSESTSTSSYNQRTQRRIIEIPLSTSFQTHHRTTSTTDSTILIGLSGILADATSLLQIGYSVLEEEQLSFGWHRLGLSPVGTVAIDTTTNREKTSAFIKNVHPQQTTAAQPSETAVRLARAVGEKCQKHAFGGGLRPLGASLLVAGADCQESSIKLAMCETEPSGAVSVTNPFWSTTPEGGAIKPPQVMVSGGPIRSQSNLKQMMVSRLRQLYREIDSQLEHNDREYLEEAFLRRSLQTVVNTLVEEWKDRGSSLVSNSDEKQQSKVLPQMEVVFTTPKRGTFRLSESDIRALMETAEDELHEDS